MKIVDIDVIMDLIVSKQEGGYWDFKREWYNNDPKGKQDMLHDIICMANNIVGKDGYIIIGVDEEQDFSVIGIGNDQNRRTTQNIMDFLRDKKFAGSFRPMVSVTTLNYCGVEFDVITVHSDNNTPYYLSENFQGVYSNNIYVRRQDTNTPLNKSADIPDVEVLWKKSFGIELSVKERFLLLLDQVDEWELNIDNMRTSYHRNFPEFTLQINHDDDREGWEPQSPFYPDPKMYFMSMNLMYHDTIIFESGIIGCDGCRLYVPYANEHTLEVGLKDDLSTISHTGLGGLHYYYYDLTKFSGKLFRVITKGRMDYNSRITHGVHLYLVFDDNLDHANFREFAHSNYNKVDVAALREESSCELKQEHYGNPMGYRILVLLVVSELYRMWLDN